MLTPPNDGMEDAMPRLDSYLIFEGTCAEAMRFHECTFGGILESPATHAATASA